MYITFGVGVESGANNKLTRTVDVSPLFAILSHCYSKSFRKVPATMKSFVDHQLSGRIYVYSVAIDCHQPVAKFTSMITVEFEFRLNNYLPGLINVPGLAIADEAI